MFLKPLIVKNRLLLILLPALLVFNVSTLYSQNYIYKGSQQYPATNTWSFPTHSLGIPENIELTVAKSQTGGYLMLAVDILLDPEESIAGTITLILSNGKLLSLTQRVLKDHVDGKSKVLYSISSAHFSLLKEYDIEKVRFTVLTSPVNTKKSYTANNERSVGYLDTNPPRYKTAEEIASIND